MFAKLYRFYLAALMCLPPCHKLFLSLVLNRTWGAGLFLLYFSYWHHTAQATPAPSYSFANTSVQTLKARQGELSHELIITLPDSYSKEPNKRYPVLYYLDAYWDFPLVYATYGNLRYDKAIPEVILVGLSIAGDGFGAYRTRYFSIFSDSQKNTHRPGQPAISAFNPRHYPQYRRAISHPRATDWARACGAKYGGLFTLYGLLQKSTPFSRFIAVNPAVAGSEAQLAQLEAARAEKSLSARLFISHGSREYGPFAEPIISYQQRLIARQYPGLALSTQELSGMGHTGGKGEAYAKGLLWALQDLAPNEKAACK